MLYLLEHREYEDSYHKSLHSSLSLAKKAAESYFGRKLKWESNDIDKKLRSEDLEITPLKLDKFVENTGIGKPNQS